MKLLLKLDQIVQTMTGAGSRHGEAQLLSGSRPGAALPRLASLNFQSQPSSVGAQQLGQHRYLLSHWKKVRGAVNK